MMIETRGLCRTFKSRKSEVVAVAGIDLTVEDAEIFGFLGPNGAGKTTTLRMLSTLLPPSGGEATVAGADLLREPAEVRKRIGYVSQAGSSFPDVTGRSELVLQGRLYGMSAKAAAARAEELLQSLDLADCGDRRTKTYSGGQKRRLDIAIGLMHLPSLLFLDEPTTGLDPHSRARMWDEVRRLRERGTTVFLTTHYLEEADALCDRLAIIDHGRIVARGTPEDLKRQIAGDVVTVGVGPERERAVLLLRGQPFVRELVEEEDEDTIRLYVDYGATAMPAILRLLDGASIPLLTLSLSRPTLDDVFLRQTGRSLRETA
jgi:ABC-2 type transport system ATP-binding protein